MTTVKALALQSFYDISISQTGTAENAFLIATANSRSLTDSLTTGEDIIIPWDLIKDSKVLQYYSARNIIPATGLNNRITLGGYGFPEGEFPFSF